MSPGSRSSSSANLLAAYFGKYLPSQAVPSLEDFQDPSTFCLFDKVITSLSPRPRGANRKDFLQQTGDCLEFILVSAFGGEPATSEFGPGVRLPDGAILHHVAWVAKCFSNPAGDSIRFKAIAVFGPQESPIEADALKDKGRLRRFCGALGRPDLASALHRITLQSLKFFERDATDDMLPAKKKAKLLPFDQGFASGRLFQSAMIKLWRSAPTSGAEEKLLSAFAAMKLDDYADGGLLNHERVMQHVPDAVMVPLFDGVKKGWPFSYLKAGAEFLQDTPVGVLGDVFKQIWRLWKKAKAPASDEELATALGLLLRLAARKAPHHGLTDLKRILRLVPRGHEAVMVQFEPALKQGGFVALLELFRGYPRLPFLVKVDLVHLLDSARGTAPKPPWKKKREKLRASGHWKAVVAFARWIHRSSSLKYPDSLRGWSDDVFGRFLKASEWILGKRRSA